MRPGAGSLGRYMLRRLLQAVPLILGILMITFTLIHLAPGDPLIFLAGEGGSASFYAEMRARYGLDQPFVVQFGHYPALFIKGSVNRIGGISALYSSPDLGACGAAPVGEYRSRDTIRVYE